MSFPPMDNIVRSWPNDAGNCFLLSTTHDLADIFEQNKVSFWSVMFDLESWISRFQEWPFLILKYKCLRATMEQARCSWQSCKRFWNPPWKVIAQPGKFSLLAHQGNLAKTSRTHADFLPTDKCIWNGPRQGQCVSRLIGTLLWFLARRICCR